MNAAPESAHSGGQPVARALLSASDKTGIVAFARGLQAAGVEILSTGGTARALREGGVAVRDVSDYTGFPEIMEGRVKTLHPRIHGGLLARRGEDAEVMDEHGIAGIDLLAVNLYPFARTVARNGCTVAEAVENIDIGGPAMVRAAAKNYRYVTVVVEPADYDDVLGMIRDHGGVADDRRFELAAKAFRHTAAYDRAVSAWFARQRGAAPPARDPLPQAWGDWPQTAALRYGENPHQSAALYSGGGGLSGARQLQGKPLSFNNYLDADAAVEAVCEFGDQPACVIVKHANPCGAACADDIGAAYRRAWQTDPLSAFGGIVAVNRPLDAGTARAIIEQQFVEVIVAPGAAPGALDELAAKPALRLLVHEEMPGGARLDVRSIGGGVLVQQADARRVEADALETVTRRKPEPAEINDLLFAWRVVKHVRSNAIVLAASGRTSGIGAGQMSRVDSVRLAIDKAARAGHALTGAALASDAFFPFEDSVVLAHEAGIGAVIQPGGSVNDRKVIAAADERGMAMVFTGVRHFRH